MQDAGVLGYPAEYFHRGDEQFWRARWAVADEYAFLLAVQREPVTVNGVWASKTMWNYFADVVVPRLLRQADDHTERSVRLFNDRDDVPPHEDS